ncbi:YitT family protein [Chloroflexota bacterium]
MFIPFKQNSFLRDFLVIQLGFALFGFSIALLIRSNLGTNAWVVLEVAFAGIYKLSPGTMSIIVGFIVLLLSLSMKERIGWGTLANIIFIGPWEDFFLRVIPSMESQPLLQSTFLLVAIISMGLATAIYIGVDAGAGPRDSLMLAVKRTTGLSLRLARAGIEISVVLVGWLLGGPLGIGTLIFALLIGPAVQWGFKLFKVQPHRMIFKG